MTKNRVCGEHATQAGEGRGMILILPTAHLNQAARVEICDDEKSCALMKKSV